MAHSHQGVEVLGYVVDIPPALHTIYFHQSSRPPQMPRKQTHTNCRESHVSILIHQLSDYFVLLAFRPWPDRPLNINPLNINKSLRTQLVSEIFARSCVNACFSSSLIHVFPPSNESTVRQLIAVRAATGELDFLRFEPAAWLEVIPTLLKEAHPVVHTQREHAGMYIIEFVVENPLVFSIIDNELTVWRDEIGLDRRNICTDHGFVWEGVCELNGPDT